MGKGEPHGQTPQRRPSHSAVGRPPWTERAAPSRRGAARRHPPCAKPAEGALPDTEVGKGGRAVPDRGRSASHGKGDLPPRHRSVAKSSGEGVGGGGRRASRRILENRTLDICLAAMCPMANTTTNPPKVVVWAGRVGRAEGGLDLRRFDARLIRRPLAPLPRRGWTRAPRPQH